MLICSKLKISWKLLLLFYLIIINAPAVLAQEELYELQSINFRGNNSISTSVLKDVIYSRETPWWFWKFLNTFTSLGAEPVYFDSSSIPIDLQSLSEYYNANGFFNPSFSYEYDVDTSSMKIYLTYLIEEGQPSRYRDYNFYGIDRLPPLIHSNFRGEVFEDTTSRYNQDVILSNINNAISMLHNNGYMFARFDSTIIFKDTSIYTADLHLFFTPGNRYRIDTILVNKEGPGAPFISERLLRNLTDINVGEYYNLEKIRRSQVRLFRTGLFNSINLSGIEQDTVENRVPLRLEGNIGLLNELAPELIVNNQQSAFNIGLGASYTRKNFFGEARRLTLRTSFGIQDIFNADFGGLMRKFSLQDTTLLGYVDARLMLEQPYVFNRPIFGIWETYATVNKQRNYNNTLYGSKITFQFEMPRFTAINMLSTYYNIEVSKEVYHVRRDSLSNKLISVIGTDFGRTTVDDILFPTRGYIITVQLEEANSLPFLITRVLNTQFNNALFYKVLLHSSGYVALDAHRNSQILAAKLKAGHLQAYYGEYADIPINRTFYSGGSNSNRGWRSNQLVPEGAPIVDELTDVGVNFKGGTFIMEGSFELRQRFLDNFGVALFTDYSNTWMSYREFAFSEMAIAAGFGLRYYTAVAPFRIDFGFKLYDPADRRFIFGKPVWANFEFHFGIGEAF
jgi:outer membrane protein insertion porin family